MYLTFPNLNNIEQRGNISQRWRIANLFYVGNTKINFDLVEIPADFVKNTTEMKKTGSSIGDFLANKGTVQSIYTEEEMPSDKYILHTEPALPRKYIDNNTKRTFIPKLNWFDKYWLNNFIKHIFLIIDHFGIPPRAIEIHPGISNSKKNNISTFSAAINKINNEFNRKYKKNPTILIGNRTTHIIKNGESINDFWEYFEINYPNLSSNVGIFLDIQQFFSTTKNYFIRNIEILNPKAILGVHIHSKHLAPSLEDKIPWVKVFDFLDGVFQKHNRYILPEVYNELHLINTLKFIFKFLK